MLRSMTGYGQAVVTTEDGSVHVEVKSLNSKFLDLGLRMPSHFADKDVEVRNLIQDRLDRGKVSVTVTCDRPVANSVPQRYNEALFIAHYQELKKLADRVMAPYDNLFETALRSPDVALDTEGISSPALTEGLMKALASAISQCNTFREDEGKVLGGKLSEYIQQIGSLLDQIEGIDPARVEKIRSRIRKNVSDFFGEEGFDKNRLEQEILFYVEKLDIHEERVRLRSHLAYFLEAVDDTASGKKLGFIAQEIGREINTIGSKANDAVMQRLVVQMKEELEKIKEQLNNVL